LAGAASSLGAENVPAVKSTDEKRTQQFEIGAANHKKLIHCYNVAE